MLHGYNVEQTLLARDSWWHTRLLASRAAECVCVAKPTHHKEGRARTRLGIGLRS